MSGLDKDRKHFRDTNRTSDIRGARADSIERVQQIVVTNGTAVITLPKVMQKRGDGRNHNNVVDGSARFFGLNILSELGTAAHLQLSSRPLSTYGSSC